MIYYELVRMTIDVFNLAEDYYKYGGTISQPPKVNHK